MNGFLKSVALAYAWLDTDLSDYLFVFPGKRSSKFFLRDLRKALPRGRVLLAPQTTTISSFVETLSQRIVAPKLDLIFLLYKCYCSLNPPSSDGSPAVSFDNFRMWGETVLNDFDEIDRYDVNPEELFKNIKDFKDIATDFLTDEQRKVMEEYFGHTPEVNEAGRFWKNCSPDKNGEMTYLKHRFLQLWEVLLPLYNELNSQLTTSGLITPGGAYRLAVETLRDNEVSGLPWKKIVFVGFNALSTAEHEIFSILRDMECEDGSPYADFFWDATGPVLSSPNNSASKFVEINKKNFPMPEWALPHIATSECNYLPKLIKVVAAPSNSIQSKIAGDIIGEMQTRLPESDFKDANVAMVLPDESLLLPTLYSLPEGIGDINLTMGYPLKLTSASSFVALLKRLQSKKRSHRGEAGFYHTDLRVFLSHPFVHLITPPEELASLRHEMSEKRLLIVPCSLIRECAPTLTTMLTPLDHDITAHEVIKYLEDALKTVEDALPNADGAIVKATLDRDNIIEYRYALRQLDDAIARYNIPMQYKTVFNLADRMLAGKKVSFEGEPLQGLQVMGLLETRSIDFDYIVIPSMNERIVPRRIRTRTFIPDTLRKGYGLPPSNYQESLFSYYFYRMISRAKEVWMIYDASPGEGLRTGDISRYVLQLQYLYAPGKVESEKYSFTIASRHDEEVVIDKIPEIKEKLDLLTKEGSGVNFSASTIKKYISCPVRFFYESVMGIKTDPEVEIGIDAITLGNIFHRVMQIVYLPGEKERVLHFPPKLITKEAIQGILDNKEWLKGLVRKTINREVLHLPSDELNTPLRGSAEFMGPHILRLIRNVLRHDMSIAPFTLYGCEINDTVQYPLSDGRTVNMTFSFDRLDGVTVDGKDRLRIVDYKSGKTYLAAENLEEVFEGKSTTGFNIFQLLLYSRLVGMLFEKRGLKPPTDSVMSEIYSMTKLNDKKENRNPKLGSMIVSDYSEIKDEFEKRLDDLLIEILDTDTFSAVPSTQKCRNCPFISICRT